jgi:anthranilate synthase component 2
VQFHPESIATEHGHRILANFLDLAGIWHHSPEGLAA